MIVFVVATVLLEVVVLCTVEVVVADVVITLVVVVVVSEDTIAVVVVVVCIIVVVVDVVLHRHARVRVASLEHRQIFRIDEAIVLGTNKLNRGDVILRIPEGACPRQHRVPDAEVRTFHGFVDIHHFNIFF